MKININAVNFDIDKKLIEFVQEKAKKLEKYYDKIVDCDVYLKVENTSDKENKIVEIKLGVPGDDLIVKKQCKTFEEAVELCRESLERQVLKKKEKEKV
jgi:putative sigma-54 modulation protein